MEEGVITGFSAALPWQPAPSEPTPSGAVLHTPNCSAASMMLSSLCCNVRQGITQMARMRCCVWCAGTPSSQAAPMAVFVTNAGGVGLIQQLPKWLTGPLCNLQDTLARGSAQGGWTGAPCGPHEPAPTSTGPRGARTRTRSPSVTRRSFKRGWRRPLTSCTTAGLSRGFLRRAWLSTQS